VDVYTTEEQQVEAIKKWWRENRWSLIGGVGLGIAIILGGRMWLENRNTFNETASAVFQTMNLQLAQGQLEQASENASRLLGDFSNTPYAALGALGMAKIKLEEGDSDAALAQLRWVLDNAKDEIVVHEARLRSSRLLLDQGKPDEAMAMLDNVEPGTFVVDYEQLKGDIHKAKGNITEARSAYSRALAELAPGSFSHQLLQMKLDELGGSVNVSTLDAEIKAQ